MLWLVGVVGSHFSSQELFVSHPLGVNQLNLNIWAKDVGTSNSYERVRPNSNFLLKLYRAKLTVSPIEI